MNTDKITTVAGVIASGVAGVITAGLITASSPIFIPLVAVGTIAGGIFAWFTNKPNPMDQIKK